MKIIRLATCFALILSASQSLYAQETREIGNRDFYRTAGGWTQVDPNGAEFAVNADVISVKFNQGAARSEQEALHAELGGTELRRAITGWADIELAAGMDVFDAIDAYMASGLVAMAEPTTTGQYTIEPDDTNYPSQWHHPIISSPTAWDITTGNPAVIVAVLDSGTEFIHTDLGTGSDGYQNIYLNAGEDAWSSPTDPTSGNGLDDDSNGFVDDWKGWDFGNNNNDASSPTSHGTNVAGVVAAKTNNATGVAGVAGGWNGPGTSLLLGGVGEAAPSSDILDDAILYALDMGAHIVQLSLTVGFSTPLEDAIQMAWDNNMVLVCSSGNGGNGSVGYPSSNTNIMSIGATDSSDMKASFSQFGPNLEISAPGVGIPTTTLGSGYSAPSGTSFSSPIISGVISLMLAVNPGLTNAEIRQILHDTAEKVGPYNYNWNGSMPGHSLELGYGRVNAQAAVEAAGGMVGLDFMQGFENPEPEM